MLTITLHENNYQLQMVIICIRSCYGSLENDNGARE